jgi:hypothetical protein
MKRMTGLGRMVALSALALLFRRLRVPLFFGLASLAALSSFGCGGAVATSGTGTSGNVIRNGDAEAAVGSTGGPAVNTPDWTSTGEATAVQYGSPGIGYAVPGAPDPGKNFFSGGYEDAMSSLSQTIDVSQYASFIDRGNVTYTLQAWLGGYSGQGDYATLTVTFTGASGAALGTGTIGPVTPADRDDTTELLERSSTGAVPPETRSVLVVLAMTREDGAYNDGYADDLSLVFKDI